MCDYLAFFSGLFAVTRLHTKARRREREKETVKRVSILFMVDGDFKYTRLSLSLVDHANGGIRIGVDVTWHTPLVGHQSLVGIRLRWGSVLRVLVYFSILANAFQRIRAELDLINYQFAKRSPPNA